MPKRTGKSKGRKKPVRQPQRKSWVLDEGVRQMIREEAVKLKLSEEEYLRLMAHFSEVVRTSILPAGVLDGGFLTMILQNPMVLEMLKGMIRNMLSGAMNKSKSVSSDSRGGLQAPVSPYGPRTGLQPPGESYGPPQGVSPSLHPSVSPYHPYSMRPPQGYGNGGPGMWGMPSEGQQRVEEAPVGDVERESNGEDGSGLDLDSIARMVGQFLQK